MGCLCNLSSARPIPSPGSMKFRRHFWKSACQRIVHVRRCRPQNRQTADHAGGGPRQAGADGPDDAGCRLFDGFHAWRRLLSIIFSMSGRSYKVIPQVKQSEKTPLRTKLMNYHIKTASGESIAVSTFATLKTTTGAIIPSTIFNSLTPPQYPAFSCRASLWDRGSMNSRPLPGKCCPKVTVLDYGRRVAAVLAGVKRSAGHIRLRADNHFPCPGRVIRKLPRPDHCAHQRAHVHLRGR